MKIWQLIVRDRIIGANSDEALKALDGYHITPAVSFPDETFKTEIADYFAENYPELFRNAESIQFVEV